MTTPKAKPIPAGARVRLVVANDQTGVGTIVQTAFAYRPGEGGGWFRHFDVRGVVRQDSFFVERDRITSVARVAEGVKV